MCPPVSDFPVPLSPARPVHLFPVLYPSPHCPVRLPPKSFRLLHFPAPLPLLYPFLYPPRHLPLPVLVML